MAFIVSRSPLSPRRTLVIGVDERRKVLRADELRSLRTAEEAVAAAQGQAEQIVGQAQAIYDAEKRRGYEEGREEARMEQAEQMIENVARNVEYFGRVEGRMVDLVMQAVQKIIDDFDDRDKVMMTVRNVLSVVRNQKQMTLRLAPNQVEVVQSRVNDLLAGYPGIGYLDIVADSRLVADACILESDIGLVEASIETQMRALREAFVKVLGSRVT